MKRLFYILAFILLVGILQVAFAQEQTPKGFHTHLSEGHVAYNKHGSGEKVIIMIHGSPGSKENFNDLLPRFNQEEYTIYALDMYGFGESTMNVQDYGIEHAAEVLKEFMIHQNIETANVLGYSWGGGVVINFAEKYPEKTENVILLAGMGLQEGEPTGSYALEHTRYYLSYPFVVFYPGGFGGSSGWRKGFMRSFMDSDQRTIRKTLENLDTEIIVIHGDTDEVVPMWLAEEHARVAKNGKLITYNGGHGKIFSDTSEIHQIIVENI